MNNYYNGQQFGYQPTTNVYNGNVPKTNKIYVTSLDDALLRYADNNTIMVYIQQDEQAIFEIFTDMQGRKSYKIRKLSDYEQPQIQTKEQSNDYVTRQEFENLETKINKLLKEKGVVDNEQQHD